MLIGRWKDEGEELRRLSWYSVYLDAEFFGL